MIWFYFHFCHISTEKVMCDIVMLFTLIGERNYDEFFGRIAHLKVQKRGFWNDNCLQNLTAKKEWTGLDII